MDRVRVELGRGVRAQVVPRLVDVQDGSIGALSDGAERRREVVVGGLEVASDQQRRRGSDDDGRAARLERLDDFAIAALPFDERDDSRRR